LTDFLFYGLPVYRAGHLFSLLEFLFGSIDSGVGIIGVIGSCIFHLSRQIILERHDVMKSSYGAGGGERRSQSPVSMLFTLFFIPLRGIATPAVPTGFTHYILLMTEMRIK